MGMKWKGIDGLAVKIPKFIASNIVGTIVDTVILIFLSTYVFDSYVGEYIVSPFISFECAVLTNYLCSFFFVWKDRVKGLAAKNFFRKYLLYNLSVTGTFVVKLGIILLLEVIFGWNVVICNLAALCFSGIINFSMGEWLIFRKK